MVRNKILINMSQIHFISALLTLNFTLVWCFRAMSCSGSQCDQSTKVQDPVLDAPQSPDITSEIFTWWGCQRHHPIEREGSCLELYPLFSCFHLHFPLWWWDPENSNSVKDKDTATCLADQKTFTYLCKGYSEHWCFVASLLFPATGFQTSFSTSSE